MNENDEELFQVHEEDCRLEAVTLAMISNAMNMSVIAKLVAGVRKAKLRMVDFQRAQWEALAAELTLPSSRLCGRVRKSIPYLCLKCMLVLF